MIALPGGPYRKLRVLKGWVAQESGPPPRFKMGSLYFSVQHFRTLVLLMLGELPVQRCRAFFEHKKSGPLHTFRTSSFCKRSCLFCVLNSDTVVLDSEWHWIFDCPQFSSLRYEYPKFSTVLRSIRENSIEESIDLKPEELWKRRFARTVLRLALRICTTFSRRVACACRTIELLLLSAVTVLVKAVNCDMITELEIVRKESEVEEQTCVLVKLST